MQIFDKDKEYWLKRNKIKTSKYWKDAEKVEKRLIKEYGIALKDLEKEFYAFSNKYGKNGKLNYSQRRILKLMRYLKEDIDELFDKNQITITDYLINLYEDNYKQTLFDISAGIGVASNFYKPDRQTIETIIKYEWNGENFSDTLWFNKQKLIRNLKKGIINSTIRGETPFETAKFLSKVMKSSKIDTCRLCYTETTAVMSKSEEVAYKDWGVEKYEFLATLDERTSEQCRNMDGRTFKVDKMIIGVNAPPLHVNCRSTTIPYVDNVFEKRIARRLDNDEVEYVGNITYNEWSKRFYK